jgi:MFS family permease
VLTNPAGTGDIETVHLNHLRTFGSLSNRNFRLYLGNSVVSMAAVNMQGMARSLLIYRLTGSAALLGVATVMNFLPLVFLSPLGGAVADRLKKKYVVLAGQILSVVMALVVAVPLSTGYLRPEDPWSWWVLVLAYLLEAVCIGLTGPAFQAMIREIVDAEHVMNAVALKDMGSGALQIVSPLVTGVVINALDFAAAFYVMAGLFFAGIIFVALIPATAPQIPPGGQRRPVADIKEGFAYVRREPVLTAILALLFLVVLLSIPYGVLLPVFTDDILKVGATGMGVLLSVTGIGATIASLVLASLPNKRRGLVLLTGCGVLGATLAVFAFSSLWYASLVLVFFIGLGGATRMTLGNTLLLYYSDHMHWGRVISVQAMVWGLSSVGALFAGLLGQAIGVQLAIGGFAFALVLVAVSTTIFVPRLRRLD